MLVIAVIGWTAAIAASLIYHLRESRQHIEVIARMTAHAGIDKDLVYRRWTARSGGVYVPVTETLQPNPHLAAVPERDITTPSGKRLTLVNPAYMTRQVHGVEREGSEVVGHITSLNPLRAENAPDPWETAALRTIAAGADEYGEVVGTDGEETYRLMHPLYVEKPCLKCHGKQGYKLGDLRGGISATVPLKLFAPIGREHLISEVKHLGSIWLLGLVGMGIAGRYVGRRITERERLVDALAQSEQRVRRIVDAAPYGAHLYSLDASGKLVCTGTNAEADRILGADGSQFLGRSFEEVFPVNGMGPIPAMLKVVAREGISQPGELATLTIGGTERALEVHAMQTEADHVAMFFRDVTERWKAERSLRESEERYSLIVNTAREGIVTADAESVITYVNARVASLLGYGVNEMVGRPLGFFIHAEEQKDHFAQIVLRKKGIASQYERRFLHRDGTTIWTLVSASPLLDESNRFLGCCCMITDITERIAMERELASRESRLRAIFDTMQAGLLLVDEEGVIVSANQRMADLFGCAHAELVGSSYTSRIHADERQDASAKMQHAADGSVGLVMTEHLYVRSDGTDFWGYLSGRRIEESPGGRPLLLGIIQDITGLKRAEESLRKSRENLAKAQRIAEFGIWEWDIRTNELVWNEEVFRLYGLDPASGPPSYDVVVSALAPESRGPFLSAVEAALSRYEHFEGEYAIIRPNGEMRHIHTVGEVIRDASGKPVAMFGIVQDITARKQMELSLKESEARLKEAQHIGRMGSWELDMRTGRFSWSDETYRIFDLPPGRAVSMDDIVARIHPDDRPVFRFAAREADRKEDAEWTIDYRIVLDSGEIRHIHEEARSELGSDGRVLKRIGVAQDVTERERSEAMIRTIAEKLSVKTGDEYFRTMTAFIAQELGMDHVLVGELLPSTRSARTIAFYSQGEHRENITYELEDTPCDGIEKKALTIYESGTWKAFPKNDKLREAGIESYLGVPLVATDNRVLGLIAAMGVRPLAADAKERSGALLRIMAARAVAELVRRRDEQVRKELEEQLLQAQRIESLGRLAGGVAHDINNMLMPVMGYADMLSLRIPVNDPRHEDVQAIIRSTERIRAITAPLLAFARKQTLDMRPLDLNEVVTEIGKMLRRTIRESIMIETRCASLPCSIMGDAGQLEQVLLNLAINAQDAMPGGGKLTVETSPVILEQDFVERNRGAAPGPHILLQVQDTGVGMDHDVLKKIFDPFFTTKASGQGTGLGLPMAYGIIKQHGGYILVESVPGEGSTFKVYFPATSAAPLMERTRKEESMVRGTETLLVVEDQQEVLTVARSLLTACGYRVLTATSGAEALEIVKKHRGDISLLITDVVMPGMNGRELYDHIAALVPALRVLYMSGYSEDIISTQGVLHSGTNFLPKPFSVSALSRKVRQVIDQ